MLTCDKGQLSLNGEDIKLIDAHGNTLWKFTYGTTAPWPVVSDGQSLVPTSFAPNVDLNDPNNWKVQNASPFKDENTQPTTPATSSAAASTTATGQTSPVIGECHIVTFIDMLC